MRRDFGNIPFLNMVYDGDEQATTQIRLEAFMYQAHEYMNERNRQPEPVAP